MKCRNCGQKCSENVKTCPNCGIVFEARSETQKISLGLAAGGIGIAFFSLFVPIVNEITRYAYAPKMKLYRILMSGPQLEGVLLFPLLVAFGVLMLIKRKAPEWMCFALGAAVIVIDVLALHRFMKEAEDQFLLPVEASIGVGFYMLLAAGVLLITAGLSRLVIHR